MAENRRRQNYIQGNTVRKLDEVPVRRQQHRTKKRTSRQVRRNRARALQMSRGYMLALVLSAFVLVALSVWYINLKEEYTDKAASVISLQQKLVTETEANDALYDSVVDSVNLTEVRKKALLMGMGPADDAHKKMYADSSDDNLKQYKKIPKNGAISESE